MDSLFLLFNLATASSQLRNNTDIEREITKNAYIELNKNDKISPLIPATTFD